MAKKNTYYFPHDSNAREDDKIIALRMDKGAAGYGLYWLLLELLSTSPDCEFERNYNKVGFVLHESAKDVKSVIEDYGLFQYTEDGKRFYSKRMVEQMESVNETREKRSTAGRKGNRTRWGAMPRASQTDGKSNTEMQQNGSKCDENLSQNNGICDEKASQTDGKSDTFLSQSKVKEIREKNINKELSNESSMSGSKPPDAATDADCEEVGNERIIYSHLVEYWNAKTGGVNGRLENIENNRRKMTRARILTHGKAKFKEAIDKAAASEFLRNSEWFNFDWLIRPNNFDKVIAGNYDSKNGTKENAAADRGDTRKHVTKPTGSGITSDF